MRRFVVVVMDERGQQLVRRRVSRRGFRACVAGAVGFLLTIAALVGHGLITQAITKQSIAIEQENVEITALLNTLESRVPVARIAAVRAELTFAQVWAKSQLGREPSMLGIGPISSAAAGITNDTRSGHILNMEPLEVPLEFERLTMESQRLQRSMGELLEYFHDAETILDSTPSINPARNPWLTSTFGRRRDPVLGLWMMHKGIDIGGQTDDHIVAPAGGVIIFAGYFGGYGRKLVIDHGYGLQTHFAHLNKFEASVGDRVRRGQLVAYMGSTGKSTGPHLHYEVRRNGQPLNPLPFIWDESRWPTR